MKKKARPTGSRVSGILLHPTSLPGRYGIGDMGGAAYAFVDFLAAAGQLRWQVLPLGPSGYGNSPYQCTSSWAGNPLLISLERLAEEGWLDHAELKAAPEFPSAYVDFDAVRRFKSDLVKKAALAFLRQAKGEPRTAFEAFCHENRSWLERFATFMALKEAGGDEAWTRWTPDMSADPDKVAVHRFIQYAFFRQWSDLKRYAHERDIEIIGDLPIFVAHDSADVWSNPELFDLDADGHPRTIAGVPPDYFSATGQCWGNPLYRWDKMASNGYAWWIERLRGALEMVDWVRLDHFRGFEKYYEIPGDATTAIHGRWLEGPGDALFAALEKALGKLPIIAEDLGIITPEVEALRDRWGFPGMCVLQFAFNADPRNRFKPHHHIRNSVVYTGTHDNDTMIGWLAGDTESITRPAEMPRTEQALALRYVHSDGREPHWDFIRAAIMSVADTAIVPLQDVLGLGSEARMNWPGRSGPYWRWRFETHQLTYSLAERLREMTELYGRYSSIEMESL